MTTQDWQTVCATLALAFAVAGLVARVVRRPRPDTHCVRCNRYYDSTRCEWVCPHFRTTSVRPPGKQ